MTDTAPRPAHRMYDRYLHRYNVRWTHPTRREDSSGNNAWLDKEHPTLISNDLNIIASFMEGEPAVESYLRTTYGRDDRECISITKLAEPTPIDGEIIALHK